MAERLGAARLCSVRLLLTIPTLVDTMNNAACEAYSAWPERIYIVNTDGIVHYKGGPGPYGFDPRDAEKSLVTLLG